MTTLLDLALAKISTLPAEEQDAIAQLILDEIDDERRWDEAFGRSQPGLARLADLARAEIGRGEVIEGDPSDWTQ